MKKIRTYFFIEYILCARHCVNFSLVLMWTSHKPCRLSVSFHRSHVLSGNPGSEPRALSLFVISALCTVSHLSPLLRLMTSPFCLLAYFSTESVCVPRLSASPRATGTRRAFPQRGWEAGCACASTPERSGSDSGCRVVGWTLRPHCFWGCHWAKRESRFSS